MGGCGEGRCRACGWGWGGREAGVQEGFGLPGSCGAPGQRFWGGGARSRGIKLGMSWAGDSKAPRVVWLSGGWGAGEEAGQEGKRAPTGWVRALGGAQSKGTLSSEQFPRGGKETAWPAALCPAEPRGTFLLFPAVLAPCSPCVGSHPLACSRLFWLLRKGLPGAAPWGTAPQSLSQPSLGPLQVPWPRGTGLSSGTSSAHQPPSRLQLPVPWNVWAADRRRGHHRSLLVLSPSLQPAQPGCL